MADVYWHEKRAAERALKPNHNKLLDFLLILPAVFCMQVLLMILKLSQNMYHELFGPCSEQFYMFAFVPVKKRFLITHI